MWKEKNLRALSEAGCDVLMDFPKSSPDLNAIETCWDRLRQRLDEHAPTEIETRAAFLARLRGTVSWMNEHLREEALSCCDMMKKRARAILDPGVCGARCKY